MARGYSNDPRRIVRLKKVKRGQGPPLPPAPVRPPGKSPTPPSRPPHRGKKP